MSQLSWNASATKGGDGGAMFRSVMVNPVLDVPGVDQGDPAILRFQGVYYLYHSGRDCVRVYESKNLVDWTEMGVALVASTKPDHWAQIDLWAPEVIYANGVFYLYVAGAEKNEGKADDHKRRIGVATSTSPIGPFEFADRPLVQQWSIDAHPFKDADGTYYMFYNIRDETTRGPDGVIGCGNVVDKLLSFTELEGKPVFVCKPDFPWEGSLEKDWYWNEGPFTIKRLGVYYQMYSGGCFYQPTYHLAYATSKDIRGPWVKWPKGVSIPILRSNEEVWGPGHHVVTKGPNGVQDYVVYHGRAGDGATRSNYIDPLYWQGDCMYIDGPTAHRRLGPFTPRVSIEEWQVRGKAILDQRHLLNYLWEFWWDFSAQACFLLAAGPGGELVLTADPENVDFTIHLTGQNRKTVAWDLSDVVLGLNLEFSTPQLIRVVRSGDIVELFINDVLVWRGTVALGPSTVGIATEAGQYVTVYGVILTGFFRDSFSCEDLSNTNSGLAIFTVKNDCSAWRGVRGHFTVTEQGLQAGEKSTLLRPLEYSNFELQVDLGGRGRTGVYPIYLTDEEHICVKFDVEQRELEVTVSGPGAPLVWEIPVETEEAYHWQHLRVQKFGQQLGIYFNERQVFQFQLNEDFLVVQDSQWYVGVFAEKEGKVDNVSVMEIVE